MGSGLSKLAAERSGSTIVVVCHGGVIDAIFRQLLGAPGPGTIPTPDGEHVDHRVRHLAGTAPRPRRMWRLVRYNDAAHLAGLPAGQADAHVESDVGTMAELRWRAVGGGRGGFGGSRARRGCRKIRISRSTLIEAGPAADASDEATVSNPSSGPNFFDALGTRGRTYADLVVSRTDGDVPRPYQTWAWRRRFEFGERDGARCAATRRSTRRGVGTTSMTPGPEWRCRAELADETRLGPVDRALLASSPRLAASRSPWHGGRGSVRFDAYPHPGVLDRPNLADRHRTCRRRGGHRPSACRRGSGWPMGSTIDAERVVVAAGAIHSPAILLRSDVDTLGLGEGSAGPSVRPFTLELQRARRRSRRRARHGDAAATRGLPAVAAESPRVRRRRARARVLDGRGHAPPRTKRHRAARVARSDRAS